MNFKPMLSGEAPADLSQLRYPVYVSPKLDGIRALVIDGVLVSRNLKPIRNKYLQERYGKTKYNGLDGELICGDPTAKDCFLKTSSVVMSANGDASEVGFHVFDKFDEEGGWTERTTVESYLRLSMPGSDKTIQKVSHYLSYDISGVEYLEGQFLAQGYEGAMLRDPFGPYKQGRSTTKEGYLLKLKRFADMEAEVIGVEEQMHNANEASKDNLGHTKRSTAKAGLAGKDTLGALVVRGLNGPYKGVEFNVGTGFDDKTRREIWEDWGRNMHLVHKKWGRGTTSAGYERKIYPQRVVKVKYFPTGSDKAPRFPTFLGFRDPSDM